MLSLSIEYEIMAVFWSDPEAQTVFVSQLITYVALFSPLSVIMKELTSCPKNYG